MGGFLLGASSYLHAAQDWQSHDSIRHAVKEFLATEFSDQSDVRISAGNLDRRLRLAECSEDLNIFWPPSGKRTGNISIGVSCESEKPWKLYVQAKVATFSEVAILSRPVVRGEVLTRELLLLESREISRTGRQFITNPEQLLGYRFIRNVNAGKALQPRMLETPLLIKKGQQVTIIAGNPTLQVRMAGQAMRDGAKGDIIRVRNLSSSRIVEGEVLEKGVVKILY